MMASYPLQPCIRSWPVSVWPYWPMPGELRPGLGLALTCLPSGPCLASCLGGATRCRSSVSRLATGFARRFSHSLSSLRNEPSAQTILLQRSPSGLDPCSHTSGQTRSDLSLIASSVSRLASLTSSLVPACRLNCASERCDAVFQSPSAAAVRQPTRRSSICTDFAISAGGGEGFSEARLVSGFVSRLVSCLVSWTFSGVEGPAVALSA